MISYFKNIIANKQQFTISLALLAMGCIFIIVAVVIGIEDNSPGIAMLFLGATSIIYSFIHPFDTVKKYLYLFIYSFFGLIVSIILHNVFDGLVHYFNDLTIVKNLMNILSVIFFFMGVLIFPISIVIGLIGSVSLRLKKAYSKNKFI